jgi:hypothetical protein
MTDIYCGQCGKYHASLTVCPNANLQAVYTQNGTTTVDLDEMRAEITRLQAREAKLREALAELVRCHDGGGFVQPDDDVLNAARAALRKEGA